MFKIEINQDLSTTTGTLTSVWEALVVTQSRPVPNNISHCATLNIITYCQLFPVTQALLRKFIIAVRALFLELCKLSVVWQLWCLCLLVCFSSVSNAPSLGDEEKIIKSLLHDIYSLSLGMYLQVSINQKLCKEACANLYPPLIKILVKC